MGHSNRKIKRAESKSGRQYTGISRSKIPRRKTDIPIQSATVEVYSSADQDNPLRLLTQPPLEPLPTIEPNELTQLGNRIDEVLKIFGFEPTIFRDDFKELVARVEIYQNAFDLLPKFFEDPYRVILLLSGVIAISAKQIIKRGDVVHQIYSAINTKDSDTNKDRSWSRERNPTATPRTEVPLTLIYPDEYAKAKYLRDRPLSKKLTEKIKYANAGLTYPLTKLGLAQPLFRNYIEVLAIPQNPLEVAKGTRSTLPLYPVPPQARVGYLKNGRIIIMIFDTNKLPEFLRNSILVHEFVHTQGSLSYMGGFHTHNLWTGLDEALTEIYAREEDHLIYEKQIEVVQYLISQAPRLEQFLRDAYRADIRDGTKFINRMITLFGLESLILLALMKIHPKQKSGLDPDFVLETLKFLRRMRLRNF